MRARFKSYEEMPEVYKCCTPRIEGIHKQAGREIDITPCDRPIRIECTICGLESIGPGYHITGRNIGILPNMVDIDEGATN